MTKIATQVSNQIMQLQKSRPIEQAWIRALTVQLVTFNEVVVSDAFPNGTEILGIWIEGRSEVHQQDSEFDVAIRIVNADEPTVAQVLEADLLFDTENCEREKFFRTPEHDIKGDFSMRIPLKGSNQRIAWIAKRIGTVSGTVRVHVYFRYPE